MPCMIQKGQPSFGTLGTLGTLGVGSGLGAIHERPGFQGMASEQPLYLIYGVLSHRECSRSFTWLLFM